jgi:hypothetical protein
VKQRLSRLLSPGDLPRRFDTTHATCPTTLDELRSMRRVEACNFRATTPAVGTASSQPRPRSPRLLVRRTFRERAPEAAPQSSPESSGFTARLSSTPFRRYSSSNTRRRATLRQRALTVDRNLSYPSTTMPAYARELRHASRLTRSGRAAAFTEARLFARQLGLGSPSAPGGAANSCLEPMANVNSC